MDKEIYELIFFVTSRCNSRCRHCFNWKNLNKIIDLDLKKIEEISKKLPPIKNLLLSGGEPFLRKDLPELINIFAENNKIESVSIPSNGLLGEGILFNFDRILKIPGLKLIRLNFSLDGPNEIHDNIRGVKNNFNLAKEAILAISKLKNSDKRIKIFINSVIISDNSKSLKNFAEEVFSWPEADAHSFEILRPMGPEDLNKLELDFSFFQDLLGRQYQKFKQDLNIKNPIKKLIRKIFFLGWQGFIYRRQYLNYFYKTKWPMFCSAGRNTVVLNDDGNFSVCESGEKRFDLDKYKDFSELYYSDEYQTELKKIKTEKCSCTHSCFMDASMHNSKKIHYLYVPWLGIINYIRYEIINNHPKL